MFELPEAKRVRREDLYSPASSPRSSPDPELTDVLREKLQQNFEFITARPAVAITSTQDDGVVSEEEELEFRLFAAPTATAQAAATAPAPAQKIRVRSPSLEAGEPGILVPRPDSYYFTGENGAIARAELSSAAVSGEDVLRLAQKPWPGCALPWKVARLDAVGKAVAQKLAGHTWTDDATTARDGDGTKRHRKGKKARIALRQKRKAVDEKKEESARLAKQKEDTEKEKRTRRNREKKVKKKERDKAKKTAEQDGAAEGTAEKAGAEGSIADDVVMTEL